MTLRELRKIKYRTAEDLALKIGTTKYVVHKWEKGISSPKIKDLPKVAKALGISVNKLVGVLNKDDIC